MLPKCNVRKCCMCLHALVTSKHTQLIQLYCLLEMLHAAFRDCLTMQKSGSTKAFVSRGRFTAAGTKRRRASATGGTLKAGCCSLRRKGCSAGVSHGSAIPLFEKQNISGSKRTSSMSMFGTFRPGVCSLLSLLKKRHDGLIVPKKGMNSNDGNANRNNQVSCHQLRSVNAWLEQSGSSHSSHSSSAQISVAQNTGPKMGCPGKWEKLDQHLGT